MRLAFEYVIKCCKKVEVLWGVSILLFLLFCYILEIQLYLWPALHFSFLIAHLLALQLYIKKRKVYDTLVHCLLNYIQHSYGHSSWLMNEFGRTSRSCQDVLDRKSVV